MSKVTIYTSLESCAQCSGIMALGKVKEVVYLQVDPGMYAIGNILFNLTRAEEKSSLPSPRPIAASEFGFEYFNELGHGLEKFIRESKERSFFIGPDGTKKGSGSVTSFLCTDEAMAIYERGAKEFESFKLAVPEFKPSENGHPVDGALSNSEVLVHTSRFFNYASTLGERGTPHKL